MAKETYYFSHDSNAITDTKILNMRADYGLEGYGLYWVLLEMMRNEEDYMLELNKNTYRAVKTLSGTSIDIEKYICDCINEYQLFMMSDDNKFYSKSFLERMLKYEIKKEKNRQNGALGGRPKNKPIKSEEKPNGLDDETQENQSKVNENKINESKENENKIKYSDCIYMTSAEYEKLISAYGKEFTEKCINVLNNYKNAHGKVYESDYSAILYWVVDSVKKKNNASETKSRYKNYDQRQYSQEVYDSMYANDVLAKGGDSS